MVVITVKYVFFVTKSDHQGAGGTFALLSILRGRIEKSPDKLLFRTLPFFTLGSAALMCSDGILTPAVSVFSVMEGRTVATTAAQPVVVPLTCAILILLFLLQKYDTARIGGVFGPIMLLWFTVLTARA